MLKPVAVGMVGAGAALWILFGELGAKRRAAGPHPERSSVRWPWLTSGVAAFVAGLAFGPAAAGLTGAVASMCTWCAAVVVRSRQRVLAAESVAQFAAVLANQAQVSRTVVDALETSAPLASGPIGPTVANFVSECRSIGVEAAAVRFARGEQGAVAAWLADAVAVAASSGGEWVPILEVVEAEAAEASATARHFHRHVAANLPQLGLAAALGAAIALGSALVSPDAWAWLSGPQGQRIGLAATVVAVAVCARPLAAAWEMLR
ncbi:hypothetical protein [Candidatus Poriferisodalis sp.]|uniref:hypothetical protein n=1 Tax=Candidatus Poriferisodalis sp. TaxID=3101277 RepID=UPI003B01C5AA